MNSLSQPGIQTHTLTQIHQHMVLVLAVDLAAAPIATPTNREIKYQLLEEEEEKEGSVGGML